MTRPRVYLAGPDVFLPQPKAFAARKKALCDAYGFEGVFPLDAEIDAQGVDKRELALRISRANEALILYLADVLDVPRSAVEVASGEHSRNKVVRVTGRTAAQVENAFQPDKKAQVP